MKLRSALFVSLALFLGSSPETRGQSVGASRGPMNSGTYTVTGRVTLPDGKPAVNARVDVSCDYTSLSTNTDPDGVYRFTGVPAGNCSVTVRAAGFDPVTEYRTVTRDTPQGQAIYIPVFIRGTVLTAVTSPIFAGVPKAALDKFKSAIEKLEKEKPDEALLLLDQAVAIEPKFAAAWHQKGLILTQKSEFDKAIEAFVKAIGLKPDYIEAKYGFGFAQFQKKNYPVAEAVFRDVITQKADMAEAHLNLGISLFYLKRTDEAVAELKSAIAGRGGEKLALAHLYLGQIYAHKKRNAEAAEELQKYIDLVPKAPNAERIRIVIADLKKPT